MRWCEFCKMEVEDDDWDSEYEGCQTCASEDEDYQKHLKQQASKDWHEDLKFDMWKENKYV